MFLRLSQFGKTVLRRFTETNPDVPHNTLTFLTVCQIPDAKIEKMMRSSAADQRLSLLAPMGVLGYFVIPTTSTLGRVALFTAALVSSTSLYLVLSSM